MQIKVIMNVTIGDANFILSDICNLDGDHKFYGEEHAGDMVDVIAERMKSAISPCFFNHDVIAEVKSEDKND